MLFFLQIGRVLIMSGTRADSAMNEKLSKKLSALGLAKLPGLFEWLSIHPIMVEVDGEETTQESSSSQKMIIFASHHKVLDEVQIKASPFVIPCPLEDFLPCFFWPHCHARTRRY
ncbi:hypothetical protein ACS0TY_035947 [Phlomoides rotata]